MTVIDELLQWSAADNTKGQKSAVAWHDFFEGRGGEAIESLDEMVEWSRIVEVQGKNEEELLGRENVVGVAASLKVTKGKPTGTRSLTVFVEEKKPKTQVVSEALVPAEVDGVPTDVVETGPIRPLLFNARVRPALPGFSIGHHNVTAGTFGCLVRDIRRCCCKLEKDCGCAPTREECPGDYLILSNNHVLAITNRAAPGDLILQPGPVDGGAFPADGVATLDRFEPIVFGASGDNRVDAAVARPTYSRNVSASILGLVIPRGVNQAFIGSRVVKVGRTTQVTFGRVLAVNATLLINYGIGIAQFRQQIVTTAMAAGGDSGSLLMDAGQNAVGLLFAGSAFITIFNHIADVEIALGARPVTAPRFG